MNALGLPFDGAPVRAEGQPPPRGVTMREILTVVFHDRRRIGLAFLIGVALTLLAAWLPAKKYTADASLLLRLGREYVYTPEVGDAASGAPMAYDREQTLQAEARILTSRDLKETVLRQLGVLTVYPRLSGTDVPKQQDAAVLLFEKALEAELFKGSNLLQVSFTHPDPDMAAKVLSTLIEAYLQKRSVIFASASYGTAEADFVARTIQLNALEARLAALKKARRIRAFAEEKSLLLAQRNALEVREGESVLALAQADGRLGSLRASLPGVQSDVTLSSETQRSEAIENARKLLLDLQLKERDLGAKFTDAHPAVQDARADIERATAFIKDLESRPTRTVRTGRSPSRDVVESDLLRTLADQQQARAGARVLASQRERIEDRLAVLADSERELQALERDRRLAEINYESSAKRLRDEMVTEELDRSRKSNVSIVQPPLRPLQGKSLWPLVLVVGLFLSVLAALLTAFVGALWRDTFLTPEEAERELGIPLLAAVPEGRP